MMLLGMCVTLAVCAVVCVSLYIAMHISLHREVDRFLEGEVRELMAILDEGRAESFEVIQDHVRRELGVRTQHDVTFRLMDKEGNRVITSDASETFPEPWPRLANIGDVGSNPWIETIESTGESGPFRVCSQWLLLPQRGQFVVQATYRLRGVVDSMTAFRRLCYLAMTVAAGLSVIGGWLVARRILEPMHRMAVTARQIGAENLSRRLDRTQNEDELDDFAAILNDMLERLERQFRQIQQFTADAAHELRTPLAALRGNAEVALSGNVTEDELRKVLENSIDEYDRLTRIAVDLLLLARADSGRPFLHFERLSIQDAVRDVADLFAPLASDKQIRLVVEDGEVANVNADGARIRQVISNLLDNAIKHTPEGGSIRIAVHSEVGGVEVTVADTGAGIPNEHLPHIFDRFYRGDAARVRDPKKGAAGGAGWGGAGLGLAICRTIIEGHGGTIAAQTNVTGTSIRFRLPSACRESRTTELSPES